MVSHILVTAIVAESFTLHGEKSEVGERGGGDWRALRASGADRRPGVDDLRGLAEEVEGLADGAGPVGRVLSRDRPGPLHVAGGSGFDLADGLRASEAPDRVDLVVVRQVHGDGVRVGRGQDVDHTGRHVGGLDDLDEAHRGQRVLARDDHHRVAHGDSRSDGVDETEQWQDIRRADADDADRLVGGRDLHPALGHGLDGATVVDGPRPPVEEPSDGVVHFAVGIAEVTAGLSHDLVDQSQAGQIDLLGHEHEDLAPEVTAGRGPLLVRATGGDDGVADVLASGQADFAQRLAHGRAHLEAPRLVGPSERSVGEEAVGQVEGRPPVVQASDRRLVHLLGPDGVLEGHVVDPLEASLAAVAALARAAEAGGAIELLRAVDPPRPRVDLARDEVGLAHVPRPDRAGETVLGVDGERDRLIGGAEGHHRQHRPEHLLARDRVGRRDVQQERRADEEAGGRDRAVGLPDLGAVFTGQSDESFDLVELGARVLGAHVRALVERIAHADAGESSLEHLDEALRDRLVQEQPRAGAADLALVEEDAAHHALDRRVEVGVVAHDGGRLAAEFHRDLLERTRGGLADLATRAGGAREHDLPRRRVAHDHAADLAVAGDDVHHSGRESDPLEELGEVHDRHRGGVPRLDHDRVAGCDHLGDLPRRHEHREVPGDHRTDDATGPPVREASLEDRGEGGMVAKVAGRERDVGESRLAERLAVVHRLEHLEVTPVPEDGPLDGVEVPRTLLARERAPGLEGAFGRGEGRVHVRLGRLGEVAEHGAGGRVDRLEERRSRLREPVVDEVAEVTVAIPEPLHALGRVLGGRAVLGPGEERQRLFGIDSHGVLLTQGDADAVRVVVTTALGVGRELGDEVVEERARSQPEELRRGPDVPDRAQLLVH